MQSQHRLGKYGSGSGLTARTPRCGPSTERAAFEESSMARATATWFPSMQKQPRSRRVAKLGSDDTQRILTYRTNHLPQDNHLRVPNSSRALGWMQLGAPQDFVGHPIADT